VNWKVGDKIVIASTDYHRGSFTQDEVVTITAVNGATVQFTPPLRFMHYGKIWQGDSGTSHSLGFDYLSLSSINQNSTYSRSFGLFR
jgi:hypothetical protein